MKCKYMGQELWVKIYFVLVAFRVVILLCEAEAKMDIGDHNGNTPLHYACSNGYIQIVKYLIQNDSILTKRLVAIDVYYQELMRGT